MKIEGERGVVLAGWGRVSLYLGLSGLLDDELAQIEVHSRHHLAALAHLEVAARDWAPLVALAAVPAK